MARNLIALKPSNNQIVQYVNDITDVTSYSYALSTTQLPAITLTPAWYADFAEKLAVSKSHCLDWKNGILTSLLTIPQSLVNLNTLLQSDIKNIIDNLQKLQANPSNQSSIDLIKASIQKLQTEINSVQDSISGLETAMEDFSLQIEADADILNTISDDALKSAQTDEVEIQKLNASVQTLQNIIDSKKQLAKMEEGLKLDITIFISIVKIVVGVLEEDVEAVVDAAISGLEDGYDIIVAADPDVKEQQDDIKNVQAEMTDVNKNIAMLINISSTFQQLLQENLDVQKSASGVKQYWQVAVDDSAQMFADMSKIIEDIKNADINALIRDLNDLSAQWNDLDEFAAIIKDVKYQFNQQGVSIS